jgi:hypothetical protein
VRWIFARFFEIGSCTILAGDVNARGLRTPPGNRFDKKYLYRLPSSSANIGEAAHKGDSYRGEHDAIIDRGVWDKVHAPLKLALAPELPIRALRHLHFSRAFCLALTVQPSLNTHAEGRATVSVLCEPDSFATRAWRNRDQPRAGRRD